MTGEASSIGEIHSNVNSGYALSGNLVLINLSALFIFISDPVLIYKVL